VPQEEAIETIYNRSYEEHFVQHPEDLEELIRTAKVLRNPHAIATTGVDLQVPAIMSYFELSEAELAVLGISPALVRLAVGVEETPALVADLLRALEER